jgi:hypothetical protein
MGAIASTMVLKEQLRRLRNKKRVGADDDRMDGHAHLTPALSATTSLLDHQDAI